MSSNFNRGRSANRWNVVFVLGPPGSGKGTQCKRIAEKFNIVHLSAGELLRREQSNADSPFAELIDRCIREGTIVPVEITCSLIESAMRESENSNDFLVDGFPRNQDNLEGWQKAMSDKVNLLFVLFLDCSTDICIKRCLKRGQSRTDDNSRCLARRITTYELTTLPILKWFDGLNLVKKVDASQDPDETYAQVEKAFLESGYFKKDTCH